jgi:two-component system, OmpR family, copper resistance phosphate regulon response regulator CusR
VRILIIEDDPKLGRVLLQGLKSEHFAVDLAEDGESGLELATEAGYDVILLDMNLPKMDGMTVLKRARKRRVEAPIMMMSGSMNTEDRVAGLNSGADDVVMKPFSFEELHARINALMRRPPKLMDKLKVADLEIDRVRRVATRSGKQIPLTQREYAVLEYLMRNAGRPVSRTMVVEHVWNLGFEGLTNIVDVYINYLRSKVDQGHDRKLIHTARGVGYMLSDLSDESSHAQHAVA